MLGPALTRELFVAADRLHDILSRLMEYREVPDPVIHRTLKRAEKTLRDAAREQREFEWKG